MPREGGIDNTAGLLREGYRYISRRCERLDSEVFETRLLLRPTICLRGRDAAELFYDNDRFRRHGATPRRVLNTLMGVGGMQGLDGAAHRDRKAMLMSVMTPESIGALAEGFGRRWRARIDGWAPEDRVPLYDAVGEMLTGAVYDWAGVPLPADVARCTAELHAMIEAPAAVGPPYLRGRVARVRAEAWLGGLVEQVRRGTVAAPEGSPLRIIAGHRDPRGRLLGSRVAAVDLLNLLRPTVAVDRFVAFAALALHQHPGWRDRLRAGEPGEPFAQEVRRFFPFFPVAAATVREPFEWQGYRFPRDRRVLLDLYGTNHHRDLWPEPEQFRPERFAGGTGDAFSLIPQGGGDHFLGHRCAGEWLTIALMKVAVTALTGWMSYQVPEQDLRVDLGRMPTLPRSRFVVTGIPPA